MLMGIGEMSRVKMLLLRLLMLLLRLRCFRIERVASSAWEECGRARQWTCMTCRVSTDGQRNWVSHGNRTSSGEALSSTYGNQAKT